MRPSRISIVRRVARAPLATEDKKGRPVLTTPSWPVTIKDGAGQDDPHAQFFVSVARREEKGSDVNLATWLLMDAFDNHFDCAVISNVIPSLAEGAIPSAVPESAASESGGLSLTIWRSLSRFGARDSSVQ